MGRSVTWFECANWHQFGCVIETITPRGPQQCPICGTSTLKRWGSSTKVTIPMPLPKEEMADGSLVRQRPASADPKDWIAQHDADSAAFRGQDRS